MAYIYDLTDTWNAGGTTFNAIKMNVTDSASAAGSKLVTLQTNGTEHFSVTKAGVGYFSGNVGIGTTSPDARLDVWGSSGDQIRLRTAATEFYRMGRNNATGVMEFYGSQTGFTSYTFGGVDGERMRIDGSGNVGIGTSSPGAKLTLVGASELARLANATPYLSFYNAAQSTRFGYIQHTGTALALVNEQAGQMEFYTNNTERMRITSSGNVGIGTSSPQLKLVVSNSGAAGLEISPDALASSPLIQSYNRSGAAYTQLGYNALQHVWQTSGTERMRIDASGNVGIGTSSPSAPLDIRGGNGLGVRYIETATGNTNRIQLGTGSGFGYIDATAGAGSTALVFQVASTERARIDSSGNVGIGSTSPANKLHVAGGAVRISDATNSTAVLIDASTTGGLTSITTQFGGSSLALGSAATERLRIKSSGGVRYIPLASAPSSPEAGEVYYDSTTNKLRCYNGTTWNDLF